MPIANKGDTIDVLLNYTIDGNPIMEGDLDEIEFMMGTHRYTLSGGQIVWDSNTSLYKILIPQEDSFDLKSVTRYQLRIKQGVRVKSTDVEEAELGEVISRSVL